ncbi:HAD-IB family hydrolase [Sphingomonas sp. ASV193]|uniref:HAD family hydrolase n=1 Tax=Sphingomonas sp. ASV193 TaxID=3144405 RepID=UPI0032E882E5
MSSASPTDLAIYDMDRTVTRRATYTPFLIYCAARRAPWRLALVPFAALSMLAYAAKLIDRGRLKEINHRLLLGALRTRAELAPLLSGFAALTARTNVRPGARAAIARDKAEGRRVVMATASYRFYAAAIAEALGFDDCIGTDTLLGLDQAVRAKIDGQNCYGPAKLVMIEHWLAREGVSRAHVRFYSDHVSDAPVFEWADEAVAVNPHDRLRRMAVQRGWAVEDWG